jgi:hypothetical protein
MFFRFGSALVLVVLISLAGTALEKRNLQLKRAISRQHYRREILLEQHSSRRVEAQRLGAPMRLIDTLDAVPQEAPAAGSSKSGKKSGKNSGPQKRSNRENHPALPPA